jgi:transcriptional regulator with XRE-family HTH domain
MSPRSPDPIDAIVGHNVRIHRLRRGLSQTELADHLGVTFQQVQKYERGTNRTGSGRLFHIGQFFDLPVERLFDGVNEPRRRGGKSSLELIAGRQSYRLLEAFSRIRSQRFRSAFVSLAETVANDPR